MKAVGMCICRYPVCKLLFPLLTPQRNSQRCGPGGSSEDTLGNFTNSRWSTYLFPIIVEMFPIYAYTELHGEPTLQLP